MKTILAFLLLIPALVHGQIITTIAGNGSSVRSGDGGPATNAGCRPNKCAIDKNGNLYFTEYDKIHKVDASGIITTFAGTDSAGYNGDGIPATTARLDIPEDIAVDEAGNVYFADHGNYRIRRIDAITNIITTVAGNGDISFGYTDGTNVSSSCIGPLRAMCIDKLGNIYISNSRQVAKIAPSGILKVVAGTETWGGALPLFFTPQSATSARLINVASITVDLIGNLYIRLSFLPDHTYTYYAAIVKVDTTGILTQYAGNGYAGHSGDGGMATAAKIGQFDDSMTTDREGNLYFSNNDKVSKVNKSGIICSVAGSGKEGFSGDGYDARYAKLKGPDGVAIDTSGNLYIVDESNLRIRKVTQPACGLVSVATVAAQNQLFYYPNPVATKLNVSAPYRILEVTIMNLIGETVFTNHYNNEKVQVDVSGLPAGMYLMRINDTEVRRFVKE